MTIVLGSPAMLELVQTGLIERAFYDGLIPALLFRSEAKEEEWPANTGQEILMTRRGLLTPRTRPLAPGVDPIPQQLAYEQFVARLERYGDTIDTYMPTAAVASADEFNSNIHALGVQAGMSLNRIPRNALFKAYLSGQTNLIQAGLAGDTSIRVAALNGFTDVVLRGQNVAPRPVSAAYPLPISIVGVTGTRNVIGFAPDDSADPWGPGTLVLDAALGAGVAVRAPVVSAFAPKVIRAGGGLSIDAIGTGDVLQLQDYINAVSWLRRMNVGPHEDGFYHAHLSTDGNAQIFTDPAFQRLNTSLPDGSYYQQAFVGTIAQVASFNNNEAPAFENCGDAIATGASSYYSQDIGAETVNKDGVRIARTIITGKGAIYEKRLDESRYVSEAGVTGKIGEFQVVNAGVEVETAGIRLILRAPLNRLQDQVAATWSISTSFPVPTDIAAGTAERYKRSVVIEHASSF